MSADRLDPAEDRHVAAIDGVPDPTADEEGAVGEMHDSVELAAGELPILASSLKNPPTR